MSAPVRVKGLLVRRPIWYALASVLLLLPCYWQTRIQAGDLSSHIYNAWLAGLIGSGRIQGLQIARQATNVLFDFVLSWLFQWVGAAWAQRMSVCLCVLVFMWGAFAFVTAVAGRAVWHLLPCLAMLAYGWTFHMGFFNFYLSLGLCFWSLALLCAPKPVRIVVAAILLIVACAAHALPVLWALTLIVYTWVARRIPERFRADLMSASLVLLALVHFAVRWKFVSRWSPMQITSATGVDQVLVFDSKYGYLLPALMLFWATCLAELLVTQEGRKVMRSIPVHWLVLTAAGIFMVPTAILVPGFRHALVYIAERMSLAAGVCFCALIGALPLRGFRRYAPTALAVIFFAFLFHDERNLNRLEDRLDRALAELPPDQRVVSTIIDPDLRTNALAHMIDRACIGRCYSYANYEPSTAQFRIRATRPNPYVISDYRNSFDMQAGKYVFKESELPVYALDVGKDGQVTRRSLQAGMAGGTSEWHALRDRNRAD